MNAPDTQLAEVLLRGNYLSEEDIQKAEEFLSAGTSSLTDYIFSHQLLTKDLLGQALAESYGVSYSDLNSNQPSKEQVALIPEEIAQKYRCVFFNQNEKTHTIIIATDAPEEPALPLELAALFPEYAIMITYALPEDITPILTQYQKTLETRFQKILTRNGRIASELLEEIFNDALGFKASDIHFEPQALEVIVRFRIDGVLQEAGRIPKEHYENLLNRIKVKSGLRIDEHFAAQDGSLSHEHQSAAVHMRTSIIPTIEGEKVVLRLLATYIQGLGLSDIGLSDPLQATLTEVARKPFGMILVVGPTGSGKTTTLYSLLNLINAPGVNITTIEDPVEYRIAGINQIQVNVQTNLTFSSGLRSIVRQDPDIILVGEIRDQETAEISVNAALTGHLLLSTFHANDAATALPRLIDIGIEPFLLSSTIELIMAQRLVRTICTHCRYSFVIKPADFDFPTLKEAERFFPQESVTLYRGKGCSMCGSTGYHGRTALFEFIRMSPDLKALVARRPAAQEIWQLAMQEGSETLFVNGLEKVKSGVTTLEELLRVAEPPRA